MFKFTSNNLILLIALVLFAGSAFAAAPVDWPTEDGHGFVPPLIADEAIGTLPTYWTDEEFPLFSTNGQDSKTQLLGGLSTEFFVPVGLEQTLIEAAAGNGLALVGPGDWTSDGQQRTRVRIFGNVRLRLDEALASLPSVSTSLDLGSKFENSVLTSSVDGELFKIFHSLSTGTHLAIDFSNPAVKSLYQDKLFQMMALSSTGSSGLLALTIKSGKIHIRLDS